MLQTLTLTHKKVSLAIIIAAFFGFLVLPSATLAGCKTALDCSSGETCKGTADELTGGNGKCEKDTFGLNPVGNQVSGKLGNQDLRETAANLINVLLGLLGLIAVVIVLAGGFKWMTAGGNEDKVGEARKMIFSGIIGLAIILSAWAISLFVINQLSTATGGNKENIPTDF